MRLLADSSRCVRLAPRPWPPLGQRPASRCFHSTRRHETLAKHRKVSLLSELWIPSAKGLHANFEKDGPHGLLTKAGFLYRAYSGIYHLLPLGLRVQDKIERLIDKHMRSIGASKLSLSSLSSETLWQQTGRLNNAELLRVKSRSGDKHLLCPTHEEEITRLVADNPPSAKSFPLRLYQISRKYRDELRPRQGLLRTREFVMKDLYTFDQDEKSALATYETVRGAYDSLFKDLNLPFAVAEADSGNMGGKLSHEYHFLTDAGEDTLFTCNSCDYAVNSEVQTQQSPSMECPRCTSGTLSPSRAVELGHTFHLGTRYSVPLKAHYDGTQPLSMGCHGIGVSRMIGAIATLLADKRGLAWPRTIAPYEAAIIPGAHVTQWDLDGVVGQLCDKGPDGEGVDVVVDDREDTMASKMKDGDLIGYPLLIIMGKAWSAEQQRVEVQCRRKNIKKVVALANLRQEVDAILATL